MIEDTDHSLKNHSRAMQYFQVIGSSLLILAGYLLLASRATLWDRDEPRFARATVEMVESGNYLYPTFNGSLRPDKPILIYWLMSLPVRWWGPTELACRFFSAVGSVLSALLVYAIARRLFDHRMGLWSMTIFATSTMVMVIGTLATADAILLPAMLGVLAIYSKVIAGRSLSWWDTLLMSVSFGLALLAKGPVGLLPLLIILTTTVFLRKQLPHVWRQLGLSCLAALMGAGIFLAWALPANSATDGEFLRMGLGHHVVQRSVKPLENHGGHFLLFLPYYIPVIIAGFFPWVLLLPTAIGSLLRRDKNRSESTRFVPFGGWFWCWTIPVVLTMTLIATKLPHYIILIWPMLSLAGAAVIRRWVDQPPEVSEAGLIKWGSGALLALIAVMSTGLLAAPFILDAGLLRLWAPLCGLLLMATGVSVIYNWRRRQYVMGIRWLLGGFVLFLIPFGGGLIPALEALKPSQQIAQKLHTLAEPDVPVAYYQYTEPSLNFYLGRPIERLSGAQAVREWAQLQDDGLLVITRQGLERVLSRDANDVELEQIDVMEGMNVAKGKLLEILLMKRRGTDMQVAGSR